MDTSDINQLCKISLERFVEKAAQLSCKVIGTIRTIFKHKKYIIEVSLSKEIVIRCFKRYNEFEALHQLICMKYKNYDMGELPSKFQLFNKEESRKKYFQAMLSQIIKDHSHVDQLHQTSKRLLSIIYLFLTSEIQPPKQKPKAPLHVLTQEDHKNQVQSADYNATQSAEKLSYQLEQRFLREIQSQRKHRLSYEHPRDSVLLRPRCNSVQNQYLSEVREGKININEFQVKFSKEENWKKRFLVIKDSSLLLFTNKFDNYFRTHVEAYGGTVEFLRRDKNIVDNFCEKMEFNVNRTFNENPSILSFYHEHDYQKILIRKPINAGEDPAYGIQRLKELKEALEAAAICSPISPTYDGVFDPIGKLFIFFHKLKLNWKRNSEDETIRLTVKTDAVTYESRPIVYGEQIKIGQGFLIPISNTFETIKIQCTSVKDEGWVKDNVNTGKIMGTYSFNMTEFITRPSGYLLDKIPLRLETAESKAQKYETTIQLSIQNMSDFSSIYSDSYSNEHDGKQINGIKGIDDLGELIVTVDRVLRVLGNIGLMIQAFWRNVYLFKYPRMGYLFFAILLFNALFMPISSILKQFLTFFLCIILYQQKHIHIVVDELLNRYLFCNLHPNFKKPLMLSTGEVKYLKWSHNMQYLAEDYRMVDGRLEKIAEKARTVFEFQVHGRKFTVKEEEQSFFEKMKEAKKIIELIHKLISSAINAIEKVANLISWIDPKRTVFLLSVLFIFSGLASDYLVRGLISIFCVHRFVKGLHFFQHKHYNNNRRFAVYCMRYLMHKHFPNIIGPRRDLPYEELDAFLCDLVFPIHDQVSQKKLKIDMDEIMGLYFDPEALYSKAIKKNYMKLVYIIDAIETCQSRLKLKWVSGAEGISKEFLQLKSETKEIPVIDVWVEKSLINFLLNIPSQLFSTLNVEQCHKIHQLKRKHKKSYAQKASYYTNSSEGDSKSMKVDFKEEPVSTFISED